MIESKGTLKGTSGSLSQKDVETLFQGDTMTGEFIVGGETSRVGGFGDKSTGGSLF